MTPTTAKTYRLKPVTVEAMQDDGGNNLDELIAWSSGAVSRGPSFNPDPFVNTPKGKMAFAQGEYIIKTAEGEFYPCKPDTFHEMYEEVA